MVFFAGPIASILVNKFGCRFVTVLGTLVAALGFIISIFAPNIYFMYFSFGVVAGMLPLLSHFSETRIAYSDISVI